MEHETDAQPRRPGWLSGIIATAVFLAAAFCYLIAQSSIAGLGSSDPAGDGMTAAFAFLGELLLWLFLGIFLTVTCRKPGLPRRVILAGFALCAAAALASVTAITLMERPTALRQVPTLLPMLTAGWGLWIRFSAPLRRKPRMWVSAAFGAAALPLIVWAGVEKARWEADAPARAAALDAAQAAFEREQEAAKRARYRAFQALGPDDPLEAYFPHINSEWHEQVIAKMRLVRSRHRDAERLMAGETELHELRPMHGWDVAVSPRLCEAYRKRLDALLAEFAPSNPQWRGVPGITQGEHDNIAWMLREGCDLRPQVLRWRDQMAQLTPQMYFPDDLARIDALLAGAGSNGSALPVGEEGGYRP